MVEVGDLEVKMMEEEMVEPMREKAVMEKGSEVEEAAP